MDDKPTSFRDLKDPPRTPRSLMSWELLVVRCGVCHRHERHFTRDELIGRFGADTPLAELTTRFRCRECFRKGSVELCLARMAR